jgi:hypothetical protein
MKKGGRAVRLTVSTCTPNAEEGAVVNLTVPASVTIPQHRQRVPRPEAAEWAQGEGLFCSSFTGSYPPRRRLKLGLCILQDWSSMKTWCCTTSGLLKSLVSVLQALQNVDVQACTICQTF